jgi:hypothetical protein
MTRTARAALSRHAMWRHITNTLAAATITLSMSALASWVLINWIVGCGEINHRTGEANIEVCVLHPTNWR